MDWLERFRELQQESGDPTPPTDTPATITRLPASGPLHCRDDGHEQMGWWHVGEDGARFCTAWACQPENHDAPPPAPTTHATTCSDQRHRNLWVIVGGRATCPEHDDDMPPDDAA
jgi:hypothetical protein